MYIKINSITPEKFAPYGQVVQLIPETKPTISVPTVNFWKQQAILSADGEMEVGLLNVNKMKMVFDVLENHFHSQTGLICTSGEWAIGVGIPSDTVPKAESLQAFRIPKGQLVILHKKCWHTAPYPLGHEQSSMLVICKRNFLDNDTVFEKIDEESSLGL